jgi:hypothetical protein
MWRVRVRSIMPRFVLDTDAASTLPTVAK